MNVLFVLEYYPPHVGGVEIIFKNLCEGLAQRGHNVTLVTSRLVGTKAIEVVNGVTIHRVRVPQRGARYWFTFLSLPEVLRVAGEADIIHTTTFNGAFPAWLISKLRSKKCIITVHGVSGSQWKDLPGMGWFSGRLHQLLEKLIISLPFDKYVCVSKYVCDCLRQFGIKDQKLAVIYNGIDYGLFDPVRVDGDQTRKMLGLGNEFVYMYYGRPGIHKGVEYLVQAVPLITDRMSDSKLLLLLAEDPRDRFDSIKKMIKNLNVEDKVELLAPMPQNELPSYIATANCVVVPSLLEGFGFAAAEACAMRKPVVASNVASLPEVVSGKYVLVEPRNPEAIADAIEKVYKGEVEDSGKRTFSWDECVERYLKVYQG